MSGSLDPHMAPGVQVSPNDMYGGMGGGTGYGGQGTPYGGMPYTNVGGGVPYNGMAGFGMQGQNIFPTSVRPPIERPKDYKGGGVAVKFDKLPWTDG